MRLRVFPTGRLLRATALASATALPAVFFPWAWPLAGTSAAVLIALVLWDFASLRASAPLTLERVLPERAFVGRSVELAVSVGNPLGRPVVLDLYEELPQDLARDRSEWLSIVVQADTRKLLSYDVVPRMRGDRRLGSLLVLVRAPLGLLARRSVAAGGDTLRVYPDTSKYLRPEALDPRRVFAMIGVKPMRRRGDGSEFDTLRDYVAGDDPRRIDWSATARRGKLVTRVFQHERNHRVLVALDASRLMGSDVDGRTKLDHSIDAALGLCYAGLVSGDRVSMSVFDREVRGHVTARAHRRDLGAFIDMLRPVQTRRVEANYRSFVRHLAVRERQRSLVVIFSDFVEAESAGLVEPLTLLARRHRVLLVAVRDRLFGLMDPGSAAADASPHTHFRRLVLGDLLQERESTLLSLRRSGVQTLDLPPESMTAPVLNRYLALRHAVNG